MDLRDKLKEIVRRFHDMETQLGDPNVVADMKRYVALNRDYKMLGPVIEAAKKYEEIITNLEGNEEIIANETDSEFVEMARMENEDLKDQKDSLEEELQVLMLPQDTEDARNAVLEIRAGTGGDEASIFAGDLFRMYTKYCSAKGWKVSIVDQNEGTSGGFKEIVLNVEGENVYGTLKYEGGVHRVQRVPATETQGRVHTSAATVIVLPEADEFDVEVKESDIRMDSYCSSGPGGQSVNTTYSAVRLTHIPTGIVAQCQDQKSKLKNHAKALSVLRSRIYEMELEKHLQEVSSRRKTMVSSGDRSAKIRTYNYPQGRITDHRISMTIYNLSAFVDGDIQEVLDALQIAENAERLKVGETI
jgi:peptide chain release factor 1